MHDRRINGETFVFGNAGGLYLRAMTWWDHKTQSIWSQPIGQAINGEMEGARLELLPFQLTTWKNWCTVHPQTFVMINNQQNVGSNRQNFDGDFVIGVEISGEAFAYYYEDVEAAGLIEVEIGELPVLIWAEKENYQVYLRKVQEQTLTFTNQGGVYIDDQTGSKWDIVHGIAVDGPLTGETLKPLPSLTSYDWAWKDFYPQSEIYNP